MLVIHESLQEPQESQSTLHLSAIHRSGFRLASFARIALPVYRVDLECIMLARKKLKTIDEFIMRTIQVGLKQPNQVAEFLGLGLEHVFDILADLQADDQLYYSDDILNLTLKGKAALSEAATTSPETKSISVIFDGLLRECRPYKSYSLMSSSEIRKSHFTAVPPSSAKAPQTEEFQLAKLDTYISTVLRGEGRALSTLLAVKAVERSQQLYLPATALVFRGLDTDEVQVSFVVDGRASPEHDSAFAKGKSDFKRRLNQGVLKGFGYQSVLASLKDDVRLKLESVTAAIDLEAEFKAAEQAVLAFESRPQENHPIGNSQASMDVDLAKDRFARILAEREAAPVRHAMVSELPALLVKALTDTKQRLMIRSRELNPEYFERSLLKHFHRAASRGVDIYIGHNTRSSEAQQILKSLTSRYSNVFISDILEDEMRELICDDQFMVLTSFDWLSGNSGKHFNFADHLGILVRLSTEIELRFSQQVSTFERSAVARAHN